MDDRLATMAKFLQSKLHLAFTYGCHATAPAPITIQPIPPTDPWIVQKEALLDGTDLTTNRDGSSSSTRRRTLDVVLDNTITILKNIYHDHDGQDNVGTILVIPILRRLIPQLIAFDIIGVQPMLRPLDYIFTLRVCYADKPSAPPDGMVDPAKLLNPAPPSNRHRLAIQILKEGVETKTRPLEAKFTASMANEKSKLIHQPDSTIIATLAETMAAEMNREVLQTLVLISGEPNTTFDCAKLAEPGTSPFIGDIHAALAVMIGRKNNLIAARTRRGAGNWCVVSPTALTILKSSGTFARTSKTDAPPTGIYFAGTLNNSSNIYVDDYVDDREPVLVGYRGSDIDAPVIYCPYTPVLSGGVVIDEHYQPSVPFNSRYSLFSLRNTDSSLGNAADYLDRIAINTDTLTFV